MPKHSEIKVWEQVEIERSQAEASHKDISALRYSESNIARYLNPPEETSFPLEYAYYLLGDVRGQDVLDFGCGDGGNSVLLARRGARVRAMDISESLIRVARHRLQVNGVPSGVDFLVASAHDLPLADESVDVVFGMAILHHLDLELVAREVRRVLRQGGRAIFREPVRNSKFIARVRKLIPYRQPHVSPFERPLTDQELKAFASGYSMYRSRAFMLPYMSLTRILPISERLLHRLYRFDNALLKRFPSLGYYAITRIIEIVK
jgi:2-polyprenyl-3-methyl-5-hydroxy-6-metoxy-1,4-benzoquinol methylase